LRNCSNLLRRFPFAEARFVTRGTLYNRNQLPLAAVSFPYLLNRRLVLLLCSIIVSGADPERDQNRSTARQAIVRTKGNQQTFLHDG